MLGRQAENLMRLVEDLLDVSRITQGKIRLKKARADLATVISRAVELAKKAATATEEKQGHILSTLAAGSAEQCNFDEAVKWSTKAVELGEGEIKSQLEKELESYKAKKPWRELKESKEKPEPPSASLDDLNTGDTKSPPAEVKKTEEKK